MKWEKMLGLLTADDGTGDGGGGDSGGGGGGDGSGGDGGGGYEGSIALNDLVSPEVKEQFGNVLENAQGVDDLVKQYGNAQSLIGRSIRVPSEDASPEQLQEFYEKVQKAPGVFVGGEGEEGEKRFRESLGVPDKPENYEVDLSFLPDEVEVPQAELDRQREIWHKVGLSPQQAQQAAEEHFQQYAEESNQMREAREKAEKELRDELGTAYEDKMVSAKYAMNNMLPEETANFIRNTPLAHDKQFVKMLAEMGDKLKDDGSISQARQSRINLTPDEAKERIQEIQAQSAYWDPSQPEHKSLVQKAQTLYAQAYPSQ